jgi:hypothetical protein
VVAVASSGLLGGGWWERHWQVQAASLCHRHHVPSAQQDAGSGALKPMSDCFPPHRLPSCTCAHFAALQCHASVASSLY